jgi:hypothetical protein
MLAGCLRTEGSLKIRGKVIDEATQKGIQWKNIIVQGVVYNGDKALPMEVGQFSTDSSGCFTYTLRKIKGAYDYNFCFVGGTEYPVTVTSKTLSYIKRNEKYLFLPLSKLVELTIKINRKSKEPLCDTLRLCWESNGIFGMSLSPYKIYNYGKTTNSFGLSSDNDLIWIGGKINSTVTTKVFAGKRTELTWELYRYGKRLEFTDTITCKRDFANVVYFSY